MAYINKIAEFVVGNNKKVLWGSTAAILLISALMVRNDLNDEFIEYFDDSIQFRVDTDFISENLTGIYNVEFSLGSGITPLGDVEAALELLERRRVIGLVLNDAEQGRAHYGYY